MGWFRITSKRLAYRGRCSKDPYTVWAKTRDGLEAIEQRATRDGLRLFRRTRARRRMWDELALMARGDAFQAVMHASAKQFATTIIDVSHAPGLPRRTIALHRLVVVPRTLVAARMRSALRTTLRNDTLASVDPPVGEFFLEQLVVELDAALAAHRPSSSKPVLTHEAWACVGHRADYEWVDPMFSGRGWGGHLLMFEFPTQGLARRARQELRQAVDDIQSSLSNISRCQRDGIIRVAADGLPHATA